MANLPGSIYKPPLGLMCDEHPDQPATMTLQGETDSFGAEYHNLCAECEAKHRSTPRELDPGECAWCKEQVLDRKPTRDHDEGSNGPVYLVCAWCRAHQEDVARLEFEKEKDPYSYYD